MSTTKKSEETESQFNSRILEELGASLYRIEELHSQLSARGLKLKPFVEAKGEAVVLQLGNARQEVKALEVLLARAPEPTPAAQTQAAPAQPTPTPATKADVPNLTADELRQLPWTSRIQFAQGCLSAEDARALIANKSPGPTLTDVCRTAKAPKETKAAPDLTGKTLTEQCRLLSTEVEDRRAGRK